MYKQLTYILKINALRIQLTKPQHLSKNFMSQNTEIHESCPNVLLPTVVQKHTGLMRKIKLLY